MHRQYLVFEHGCPLTRLVELVSGFFQLIDERIGTSLLLRSKGL